MTTTTTTAGELEVERLRRSDHAAALELAPCPLLNVAWRDWLIAEVDAGLGDAGSATCVK